MLLERQMSNPTIQDATMQFAFGAERIFKGILFDINPIFLLESESFDNAVTVLYRDRLIPKHREKADKEAEKHKGANTRLLPFQGAMLRAARFSRTTEDHIGTLTKLSDYRGVIAHRTLDHLPHAELQRFVLRVFQPLISAYALELDLSLDECTANKNNALRRMSVEILQIENFEPLFQQLLADHQKQWDKRKGDAAFIERTLRRTRSELVNDPNVDSMVEEFPCPACGNPSILFIDADWDVEGSRGTAFITGVYVSGLECRFCDLELNDYEQFDYLKLNEWLARR